MRYRSRVSSSSNCSRCIVCEAQIGLALAQPDSDVPQGLQPALAEMLREIAPLEEKILRVERQLAALTRTDQRAQQLREIPGVGLLSSTALLSTVGDIQRFPSRRHFACWLGLTPSERSSAERRRLGKISKQGDVYCRTLLVHPLLAIYNPEERLLDGGVHTR